MEASGVDARESHSEKEPSNVNDSARTMIFHEYAAVVAANA
jgi:hypothetical protein